MEWEKIFIRYKSELIDSVLPFWEKNCLDEKYGGYFTMLDREGRIYDTTKYMWMQWRIVYIYAWLASNNSPIANIISEEKKEKYLNIAKNGFQFLINHGKDENSQYYFALNRKGQPIIAPYNIYSQAFAVMGASALYNAEGLEIYKDEALKAMDSYIDRISDPKGKWEKSLSNSPKRHSLGHYMILANLGSIIQKNLKINDYDGYIDTSANMVINHFYNPKLQVIFENISTSHEGKNKFTFDLESCEGRHLNPGHGLEACWFILEYLNSIHDNIRINSILKIIDSQMKIGWDPNFGGIFYFMDALGKPHQELNWDMKLWWVHNEALIANLYAYTISGDKKFLEWFKKIDEWVWAKFPDQKYGEWFGYLNRRGEPTHFLKGGKWKTCFHLPRSLFKCLELMKTSEDQLKEQSK